MASDENIRKMVHAIMDKRKELGIIDWGIVAPEEVIQRLNRQSQPSSSKLKTDAESGSKADNP